MSTLSNRGAANAATPKRFRAALLAWFAKHGRDLPWRRTRDPYAILVSELMLQQTQVATVLSPYREWLRRFPDFVTLAAAAESEVLHAWQGLGYYARARNLHASAKAVAAAHGGAYPQSISETRKLPGIGRYTAHAVATFAFDQSVPIVEANTARLLARLADLQLRIDSSEGEAYLWNSATALLPARDAGVYNSALIDLGAMVCVAGQPRCGLCPVRAFCRATNPVDLPRKRPRAALQKLTEQHAFVEERGRILLEQSTERWRGMWMLPRLGARPRDAHLLHRSRFPFTHHSITLDVFATRRRTVSASHRWFAREEIPSIPLPSPHRRALAALLEAGRVD